MALKPSPKEKEELLKEMTEFGNKAEMQINRPFRPETEIRDLEKNLIREFKADIAIETLKAKKADSEKKE